MKKALITSGIILLIILVVGVCFYKKHRTISPYKTQSEWAAEFVVPKYSPNKEISGKYDMALSAKCENGIFVGKQQDDVIAWKGIPFAKQPVGDRRFKSAIAPDKSDKVFEAYNFGPSCMQPYDKTGGEKASWYKQGEDCLNLNIWSNVKDKTNKPVLVYIHGGGWVNGGTSDPLYNGQFFVQNNPDIILVTVTYRMGMMGIINLSEFPDGADYITSTNNGILDLVQSLKWIKNNIAAFGGNPNNITIAGESAGGGAVSTLCTLPMAQGLFQKAIPMSGSVNQGNNLDKTFALPNALKRDFNVANVADIQKIDFDTLYEYWNKNNIDLYSLLIRDGIINNKDPYSLWERGDTKDLIIMQGHTADEFVYFRDVFGGSEELFDAICQTAMEDNYEKGSAEFRKSFAKYVKALNDLGYSGKDIARKYMDDRTLSIGNTYQAIQHAKNGGVGYSYTFEKEYDYPDYLKSAHAIDCFYLFGTFDGKFALGTNEEVDLALEYQRMIANFCKTGNPSTPKHTWPQYNNETRIKMMIGDNMRTEENPQGARVDAALEMVGNHLEFRYVDSFASLFPILAQKYPDIMKKFLEEQNQ